jgi:hypothetical protein
VELHFKYITGSVDMGRRGLFCEVTGWGLETGIQYSTEDDFLLYATASVPVVSLPSPIFRGSPGVFPIQRSKLEANHSPPSNVDIKNTPPLRHTYSLRLSTWTTLPSLLTHYLIILRRSSDTIGARGRVVG